MKANADDLIDWIEETVRWMPVSHQTIKIQVRIREYKFERQEARKNIRKLKELRRDGK